ncbi:uncharacterized protein LOC116965558 isoform X2 [Tyto alba]|uniref:uncharacterized protein LOC116965558 isoform X2 n=1 Tax=Tyto alba TaxID=56313 RepID=UPI001C665448|nr:uncharacterized protein LOC116965558 isoform X2 [Tyto alba]
MFSPKVRRRGFPREPNSWQAGPLLPHLHGPQDDWDEPCWENQHRRGRDQWHPIGSWDRRPFPGPDNFQGNENRRWAPYDCPPLPPWDSEKDDRGPENFREDWQSPGPWDPRPFPGPGNFQGNEQDRRWGRDEDRRWGPDEERRWGPDEERRWGPDEERRWGPDEERWGPDEDRRWGPDEERWRPDDPRWGPNEERRWGPNNCPLPSFWDDREDYQGNEDFFEDGWHPELLPGPNHVPWSEFPNEERHPSSAPADLLREQGSFQSRYMSWRYKEGDKRWRHLRHGYQELTFVQHVRCPWPSRGHRPSSISFPSCSGMNQLRLKERPKHPDPAQPLNSSQGDAQSRNQKTTTDVLEVSAKVPEPPKPASTPQKSVAADSQAATEAAEPEQAAGTTPVEEQAGMLAPLEVPGPRVSSAGVNVGAGSHDQSPSALETESATLEKSSTGTEEHLEVEPCSQSVPRADADGGSHPHGPAAPPEPAESVCAAAGSAGEVGAELCPHSGGQQCLPSGAGEAETEAARDGLLGDLQPSENSQVPPGPTVEPEAQPGKACSDICAAPETSPGTQHPPGSGETEPAAGSWQQLCSTLPTPSPASTDLRSAAVLARKEEIELSYQQFSLTVAVVATMLLQKEPSMEAALGLALRANLRQRRIHHLQELEDFIDSYDSATLSR